MVESRPGRVVIVDDREENRYVLERILRNAGYLCEGVDRGARALELALTDPDLIILDVQLPDMSGYDVCRRLKADPVTSSIMILQVSASFVSNDDRVKALDAGADAYITHPIDRMVLVATVRALLRLRAAETASRKSSDQWQTTFDSLLEGVALIDEQGCIVRWNSAFFGMCGVAAQLQAGESAALLLERMIGTSEPLSGNDQRFSAEYGFGKRALQVSVNRIDGRAAEGEKVLILADTTDRKLAEHALRMAERLSASGKMANAIAHEINNPLEALTNLIFLARSSDSMQMTQPLLEAAARELDRVSRITKQSLSFHRDTDKPIEVDLGELLEDVTGMMDRSAAVHRVRLTLHKQAAGKVRGFSGQLVQVFSNLIRNAIEVSSPGTEVTVRLSSVERAGHQGNRVTVHDRGAGIPADIRANIFDPFFTTKQLRGSGLGLWVSRSLVTRHQGTIRFRSCQLPGRSGTTFEVFIPSVRTGGDHKEQGS
ncbi:MAG: response regulator [Acidobacteria bacterium]|nr:response regulator [Acidobacteriota bacterium]